MKKTDIEQLPIEELRPLVQRGLKLQDWPGDWDTVGIILRNYQVSFEKFANTNYYRCLVWMKYSNGSGHDDDPLAAIFRAFVMARWNEAEVENSIKSKDDHSSKEIQ